MIIGGDQRCPRVKVDAVVHAPVLLRSGDPAPRDALLRDHHYQMLECGAVPCLVQNLGTRKVSSFRGYSPNEDYHTSDEVVSSTEHFSRTETLTRSTEGKLK